ncbi:MAG: hypothetical protein SFW63_01930 [Alphaproteobacteria bacterium]|nr:hypothetical protein [Alphaproteobacteria bacterium]
MSAISPDKFKPQRSAAEIAFAIKHFPLDNSESLEMPRTGAEKVKFSENSFAGLLHQMNLEGNTEAGDLIVTLDTIIVGKKLSQDEIAKLADQRDFFIPLIGTVEGAKATKLIRDAKDSQEIETASTRASQHTRRDQIISNQIVPLFSALVEKLEQQIENRISQNRR